jgi:hypothetical protein
MQLNANERSKFSLRQLSGDQRESLGLLETLCGSCVELWGFATAAELRVLRNIQSERLFVHTAKEEGSKDLAKG